MRFIRYICIQTNLYIHYRNEPAISCVTLKESTLKYNIPLFVNEKEDEFKFGIYSRFPPKLIFSNQAFTKDEYNGIYTNIIQREINSCNKSWNQIVRVVEKNEEYGL
jgi:hypothetical protein